MNVKKLLIISAFSSLCAGLQAVPASPELNFVDQPDGSVLSVRLCGDEFFSYYTTTDDHLLAPDEVGNFYYAVLKNGNVVPTDKLAHNVASRTADEKLWLQTKLEENDMPAVRRVAKKRASQHTDFSAHMPLRGEPRSLVVLMEFPDLKFVTPNPQQAFTRLLNESGYSENNGIGSARDYFIASSDSVFAPHFDVYGPFTAANSYEYYGADAGDYHDRNVRVLIREACSAVVNSGVDLKQYDTDGDGMLDNVFVYYAGHNQAEWGGENTIWPHRSVVGNNVNIGGVNVYDYACTSELRGSEGNEMCGIGTFSHEFGHVLGLPDFYDTDNNNHYTVGMWDIMCSGSYNGSGKMPPSYTSYERFSLGWLVPQQLEEAGAYLLKPLETSNRAYLLATETHNLSASSPSPKEFFLLENRQQVGWDKWLPGTGMLVWHIDYDMAAWENNSPNNNTPCRMHLQEADGTPDDRTTSSDPYPGSRNITSCGPVLHDGTLLPPLFTIQQVGDDIAFIYKSSEDTKMFFVPEALELFQSTYDGTTQIADCQTTVLQASGLDPENPVTLVTQNGFEFSLDSVRWNTSSELVVSEDSALQQKLYLRYNPRRQVCDVASSSLTAQTETALAVMPLQGTSVRPMMITEPQIDSVYNITPYSFEFHFEPQTDAENYYATLYYLEEKEGTLLQGFEQFNDASEIAAQGWISSTTTTTTTVKDEGNRSLWLQQNGDMVTSQLYAVPITNISFWLNAMTTSDNQVGTLKLEAFNGEWVTIDEIEIQRTMRKYTYQRDFNYEDAYVRFRLTYMAIAGNGVALDAFKATADKELKYIFKGREKVIKARNGVNGIDPSRYTVCLFTDLLPNTDYYVQMQCSEEKGCTERISEMSVPYLVHTMNGADPNSKYLTIAIDSVTYDRVAHVVYLPNAEVGQSVYVYDVMGHIVWSYNLAAGEYAVVLPTEYFIPGNIYIVKYSVTNRVKRKDKWVKIMF